MDLISAFEELGNEVIQYDIQQYIIKVANYPKQELMLRKEISAKVETFILNNNIDFALGIWSLAIDQFDIEITETKSVVPLLEKLKIPTLCYWWDTPYLHKGGEYVSAFETGIFAKKYQIHCINDKYVSQELTEFMNFKNVLTLPFAVDPKVFYPHKHIEKKYDIVFFAGGGNKARQSTIPTNLMLEELQNINPNIDAIRADLALNLKKQIRTFCKLLPKEIQQLTFSFCKYLLDKRIENKYIPIYKIIKDNLNSEFSGIIKFLFSNPALYIKLTSIIRSIESGWHRDFMVAYLYKHFNCIILGAVDYTPWGINYKGDVIPKYNEQSVYYSSAKFGLNVVRWEKDYCVNQKIFEIMASKCCCLQEYRENINDLFDIDKELVSFKTPFEAKKKIDYLLKNTERISEIAEAGYKKTLLCHTWKHRMANVIEYYKTL